MRYFPEWFWLQDTFIINLRPTLRIALQQNLFQKDRSYEIFFFAFFAFLLFLVIFCRLKEFERFVRSFTAELICIEWKECLCELNPFKSIHRGKNILITFRKRKKPSEKCLQLESCYCSLKILFIFTMRSNFFLLTKTIKLFLGLNKGTISTDIHLI